MVAMATTSASAAYMTVPMTRRVSMLDLAYIAARYMYSTTRQFNVYVRHMGGTVKHLLH